MRSLIGSCIASIGGIAILIFGMKAGWPRLAIGGVVISVAMIYSLAEDFAERFLHRD